MVGSKLVVTTDSDSAAALAGKLQEAWDSLGRSEPASEQGTPRAKLLAQPWSDLWEIRKSPTPPMGIAGNEAEFLIILRDVGVYLADKGVEAVMAAAAQQLVAEAIQWVKRRHGADSIELRDSDKTD